MAWTYLKQYLFAGTVTDPRDFMENVNGLAAEVNGFVDRDNVGELQVTTEKVVTACFNTVGKTELDVAGGSTGSSFTFGETGQWTEITELSTTVSTDDGRLLVDAWVNYQIINIAIHQYQDVLEFRLLIDGQVVDETGWCSEYRDKGTRLLIGSIPVDAGSHTIVVQWRAYGKPYQDTDNLESGSTTSNLSPETTNEWQVCRGIVIYRHQKR